MSDAQSIDNARRLLPLDSFEAEVKRSWFSVRQSLRGVTSRDKLWIPATVTIVGDSAHVSSSEGVEEFRARRLIWHGPESFVITGLSEGSRFKRAHLKLAGHEEALRAVSMLEERLGLEEQPVTQIEEVGVDVRFLISSTELFLQIPTFLIKLAISGFVISIFSALGIFGLLSGVGVVAAYFGLRVWGLLQRTRRRVNASLRFESHSLMVLTSTDFTTLVPKVIEWKGPQTFLLKGGGSKLEFSLPTREEAVSTASKIRIRFPRTREIVL